MKPEIKRSEVLMEGVLTMPIRAEIVKSVLKFIVYERELVPELYDTAIKQNYANYEPSSILGNRQKRDHLKNMAIVFKAIDYAFDHDCEEALILFGNNVLCPAEVFRLQFPPTSHANVSTPLPVRKYTAEVIRNIIQWKDIVRKKSLPSSTGIHLLFLMPLQRRRKSSEKRCENVGDIVGEKKVGSDVPKEEEEEVNCDLLVPKLFFAVSRSAQQFIIDCKSNVVFEDFSLDSSNEYFQNLSGLAPLDSTSFLLQSFDCSPLFGDDVHDDNDASSSSSSSSNSNNNNNKNNNNNNNNNGDDAVGGKHNGDYVNGHANDNNNNDINMKSSNGTDKNDDDDGDDDSNKISNYNSATTAATTAAATTTTVTTTYSNNGDSENQHSENSSQVSCNDDDDHHHIICSGSSSNGGIGSSGSVGGGDSSVEKRRKIDINSQDDDCVDPGLNNNDNNNNDCFGNDDDKGSDIEVINVKPGNNNNNNSEDNKMDDPSHGSRKSSAKKLEYGEPTKDNNSSLKVSNPVAHNSSRCCGSNRNGDKEAILSDKIEENDVCEIFDDGEDTKDQKNGKWNKNNYELLWFEACVVLKGYKEKSTSADGRF